MSPLNTGGRTCTQNPFVLKPADSGKTSFSLAVENSMLGRRKRGTVPPPT
ncbi:MAG: hypothetical protein FGF48_09710 [Candidatus Brockarchaeota archaeon]|nr:hypothetical protein [Candidatus Brockarchaeota archaeon]